MVLCGAARRVNPSLPRSPERHSANVEQELLLARGDLLGQFVLEGGVERARVFEEGCPFSAAADSVLGIVNQVIGGGDGGSAVHGVHRLHLAKDGSAAFEHVHAATSVGGVRPPHSSSSSTFVLSSLAGIIASRHNSGGGGLSPSSRGIRTSLAKRDRGIERALRWLSYSRSRLLRPIDVIKAIPNVRLILPGPDPNGSDLKNPVCKTHFIHNFVMLYLMLNFFWSKLPLLH